MPTTLDTTIAKTTLAAVKRQLNIASGNTDHDSNLTELINAASVEITTMLGRELVATDYVEWIDVAGQDRVNLRQWPLINLNRVASGTDTAFTVQYTGSDTAATAQVTKTSLILKSYGTSGITATTKLWSDFETAAELVTEIVANVTDWTATLNNNTASRWLRPSAGIDAASVSVDVEYADQDDRDVNWDLDAGVLRYRYGNWGNGYAAGLDRPTAGMGIGGRYLGGTTGTGGKALMVDYRAGYETIPYDIEMLVIRMVRFMFNEIFVNPTLQSETLGSYSYTLATKAAEVENARVIIDRYREVVLA